MTSASPGKKRRANSLAPLIHRHTIHPDDGLFLPKKTPQKKQKQNNNNKKQKHNIENDSIF